MGSIEKLCECGWCASKTDVVCRRSGYCGSSIIFLRYIYEQSCAEPRKSYLRNISCGVRNFSWHSGFSDPDVADISVSLTHLLNC